MAVNSNTGLERQITLKMAVVVIGIVIICVVGIGFAVGNAFFWNQFDKTPIVDRQMQAVEKIIKANPKDASILLRQGDLYIAKQDYASALKEYEKAYKLNNKSIDANFRLGVVYNLLEKYEKAIPYLEYTTQKYNFNYGASFHLGLAYFGTNQLDKSIKAYDHAAKIDPGSADTYYELSRVYEKKGDKAKALEYVNKALSFVPNYEDALKQKEKLQ
jgi:tetratricopeptide (TPR) repeat protein